METLVFVFALEACTTCNQTRSKEKMSRACHETHSNTHVKIVFARIDVANTHISLSLINLFNFRRETVSAKAIFIVVKFAVQGNNATYYPTFITNASGMPTRLESKITEFPLWERNFSLSLRLTWAFTRRPPPALSSILTGPR